MKNPNEIVAFLQGVRVPGYAFTVTHREGAMGVGLEAFRDSGVVVLNAPITLGSKATIHVAAHTSDAYLLDEITILVNRLEAAALKLATLEEVRNRKGPVNAAAEPRA